MPAIDSDSGDIEELEIFPLLDSNNDDSPADDHVKDDGDEESEHNVDVGELTNGRCFKPLMSLRQRRRSSLLSSTSLAITIPDRRPSFQTDALLWRQDSGIVMSPRDRWRRAVRRIRTLTDPWAKFPFDSITTERAKRHRYNALKRKWVFDDVLVKMEGEPFNHGALRACYRLKKLSARRCSDDWKQQAHNYVAKSYMEKVSRDVYFEDVRLQMDAKLWGEEYNRHNPPKKVDVLQISILEFTERPGRPLFHLEHFIDGEYIKYNSNSGFVDENLRLTPQAFSHFTFERSSHQLIVVDIQGVGDLWTDPQIHTADGLGYGDGNLGTRGMALFFHSHTCNQICTSLELSKFDLAPSEILSQETFVRLQKNAMTRLRGIEEVCRSASPIDSPLASFFFGPRNRCISTNSSAYSGDDELATDDRDDDDQICLDIGVSPTSPPFRRHRKFLSDTDESSSATMTEGVTDTDTDVISPPEEERIRFQRSSRMNSRPSCVALEIDFRKLQKDIRLGSSVLGQVHHELAKYHEIGRFLLPGSTDPVDLEAALFHEQQAADLGVNEAAVTLANIYLQRPHDILANISVEETPDNEEVGVNYMIAAGRAGDRSAMVYLAKAYESGTGLGIDREKSYIDAVEWYERAVNTTSEDDCGDYDATMDDPVYQLQAAMAQLYLTGGCGLCQDPSTAGDLFTSAAEGATEAMKGRLANRYFALAEEAWALVEE